MQAIQNCCSGRKRFHLAPTTHPSYSTSNTPSSKYIFILFFLSSSTKSSKPAKAVRTLRDLFYWQYAKLIAESAGYGKTKNYGFIMDRFQQLKNGEIQWSGSIKEYIKGRERPSECIYCGSKESLSTDHLIPKSRGGPDIGDNAIIACKKCNSSKRDRGI